MRDKVRASKDWRLRNQHRGKLWAIAEPVGLLGYRLFEIEPATGDRTIVGGPLPRDPYTDAEAVPTFYAHASMPGLTSWAIPLLVGFLIGAAYMKGRLDGKVTA